MSSAFYLSKTVRVFCLRDYQVYWLAETIEVICPFTFQRPFNVFCQDYHSLLYIFKNIKACCHANIIIVICFFTFPRLSESFVSRLLQSSLHFQDYQKLLFQNYNSLLYFSNTTKVCCLAETINVFRPLHFQRPSESFVSKTIRVFC